MNDRSKLPKWAQQELDRLDSAVEYHKSRLAESLGQGAESSDTEVYMGYKEKPVGLPDGTPVHFKLSYGRVGVRVKDGKLEVSGLGVGGGLAIFPHVSNLVNVSVVPR